MNDASCHCGDEHVSSVGERLAEAFAMLLLVGLLAFGASVFGLTNFTRSAAGAATIGGAVFIGLVAATSTCLAAVGGLLLSVSATWAQANPGASKWKKLQPQLLFNGGRLMGYFVLGGLVGLLGQAVAPSVRSTGILMIMLAGVMLYLGLRMLRLLPESVCHLPQHSFLGRKIAMIGKKPGVVAPFLLGAFTFFLPCGFTQSMQLTALATRSFWDGGILMLAFALGTLPALLGISILSSSLTGRAAHGFFRFAGAVTVFLALLNLRSGLTQAGLDAEGSIARAFAGPQIETTTDPSVTIDSEGRQIISLAVDDHGYTPGSVTIDPGKTTWIYAVAAHPLAGCASFLTAPAYNLSVPVRVGGNWLGPIENPQRDFLITCSMGMLKANVHVRKS